MQFYAAVQLPSLRRGVIGYGTRTAKSLGGQSFGFAPQAYQSHANRFGTCLRQAFIMLVATRIIRMTLYDDANAITLYGLGNTP